MDWFKKLVAKLLAWKRDLNPWIHRLADIGEAAIPALVAVGLGAWAPKLTLLVAALRQAEQWADIQEADSGVKPTGEAKLATAAAAVLAQSTTTLDEAIEALPEAKRALQTIIDLARAA
jgi:hypothetical protein